MTREKIIGRPWHGRHNFEQVSTSADVWVETPSLTCSERCDVLLLTHFLSCVCGSELSSSLLQPFTANFEFVGTASVESIQPDSLRTAFCPEVSLSLASERLLELDRFMIIERPSPFFRYGNARVGQRTTCRVYVLRDPTSCIFFPFPFSSFFPWAVMDHVRRSDSVKINSFFSFFFFWLLFWATLDSESPRSTSSASIFFFFLLVGISVFSSFPCKTTPHSAGRCILQGECRLTLVWQKCHKTSSAMICTEEYRFDQSKYTILEIVGMFLYNTKAIWKLLNSKLVNCTTKTHFI